MSLKSQLNQIIKERKYLTLKELEDYCHKAGYKISNAERRLRESPEIEPVYNPKHTAIIAYRPRQSSDSAITDDSSQCCYSYSVFKTHTPDCPILEQQKEQAKILLEHRQQELGLIKLL